jgi:putative ABC transport system permease protein
MQAEVNPSGVQIAGHTIPPSGSEGDASTEMVNPAFMRALRLRLIKGRFLEEHDNAIAAMAAVVNESFARTFLPNEGPIGKRAKVWYGDATIVGVIADFKFNGIDRKPFPEIFWSLRQSPGRNVWIMARSSSDPSTVANSVRQKIHDFDPDLPVQEMHSMTEVIADSLWLKRLSADLLGLVAALAIILAAAGIYSVMSYSVSRRLKEMGIRMAFGASRRDVFGLIMAETSRLALIGSALGFIAAFIASRVALSTVYLAPSLASTQSKDSLNPMAFAISSLFLFAVVVCASYAPARRALRVDPAVVLQHE